MLQGLVGGMRGMMKRLAGYQVQRDEDRAPVKRVRFFRETGRGPEGSFMEAAVLPARLISARDLVLMVALIPVIGGCAVVAVADAAVTVTATAVKVGAKVVGAAVDAVIPDDDQKKK